MIAIPIYIYIYIGYNLIPILVRVVEARFHDVQHQGVRCAIQPVGDCGSGLRAAMLAKRQVFGCRFKVPSGKLMVI